ncbi:hypothetical protein OC835_005681 [Tilletia horrida]|uniref:GST N-terminal domain-containing protein n=1 Tax=Tilletia horrida TaxID=155126 RepID=A0AAN6GBN0_9BASI|nr:hypothetical protein OC835_005681 [Tilletia horrida]KAK0531910.1 hypothetical protein OC842_003472 [Tilletia horrida]
MAPPVITFYDVASSDGPERYFLPNPWVSRMCLVHKGLDFTTHSVPLEELRAAGPGTLRERLAHVLGPNDRPLVPMIDVPGADGQSSTLVGDTVTIAEYLDANFPQAPSLFLPSLPPSDSAPDAESPAFRHAHTMARLLKEGIGNSDAQWAAHFELCAAGLADAFATRDREYMTSDAKLGLSNGWSLFEAMDRAAMLAHTRRSLLPICAILNPTQSQPRIANSASPSNPSPGALARPSSSASPQLFLASPEKPGFIDYVLFGRYAMTRGCAPELNKAIWSRGSAQARAWLKSYRDGKWALGETVAQGQWFGDVELPGIEEWVERMLDAHGGYARKFLAAQETA